jgi:hypothetical protein
MRIGAIKITSYLYEIQYDQVKCIFDKLRPIEISKPSTDGILTIIGIYDEFAFIPEGDEIPEYIATFMLNQDGSTEVYFERESIEPHEKQYSVSWQDMGSGRVVINSKLYTQYEAALIAEWARDNFPDRRFFVDYCG